MSRHNRAIPEFVMDNLDILKTEALKHGYTLSGLADTVGISRTMVKNLSTGWTTPSENSYNKIAAVLGWKEWA